MPTFTFTTTSSLVCLLLLLLLSPLLSQTLASTGIAIDGHGDEPCPAISEGDGVSCPIRCFRPDPVCGADGVTYWCGCPDAACAGARVVKKGYCEVGSGGAAPVSGQALLLVHIVWLFVLGVAVLFGFL